MAERGSVSDYPLGKTDTSDCDRILLSEVYVLIMCSVSLTDTEDMCVSVDHSSSPMGEKRVETTSVIAASLENVHPRTRTSSQFHSFVSPFVGVRWDMSSAPYQDVSGDSTCLHDCLITGLFGNLFL